jgi:hypothetical protein
MPNRQAIVTNDPLNTTVYGIQNGQSYPLQVDAQGRLLTTNNNSTIFVNNFPLSSTDDLRTIQLSPVAGWTFNYTLLTNLINFTGLNGGSQSIANSMIQLQTGTETNGSAEIETQKALRYTPGLGALVRFTAVFTTGVTNSEQIIGIGDESDGFFVGYNGTSFGILVRKDGVDSWIPQSSWDVDKMDGSGPSGMMLNPLLGNSYQIDYQWGFGQITFYVATNNPLQYAPVHHIDYPNTSDTPSILNPTLPLRASVRNTGNSSNVSLFTPTAMAFVEGPSYNQAISSRYTHALTKTASSTLNTLFTLTNDTTFNGKTNRVRVLIDYISLAANVNNLAEFIIIKGVTTSGGTFQYVDQDQSVMLFSEDTTISGGTTVFDIGVSLGSGVSQSIPELDIWLSPGETLAVSAKSKGTGDLIATLSWIEFY